MKTNEGTGASAQFSRPQADLMSKAAKGFGVGST